MRTPPPAGWTEPSIKFTHALPWLCRPGPRPDAPLIVICHGMGETPASSAPRWARVSELPVHLVVPAGPFPREVRDESQMRVGYAWYLYDGEEQPFRDTAAAAREWLVRGLAEVEAAEGFAPARRALIGYSQGAYFGYLAALHHQDVFSHLVAVAGRLKAAFAAEPLRDGGKLQTLILHGEKDRAVSGEAARRSEDALAAAGYSVECRLLPGGHRLHPDRDAAAAQWLAGHGFAG